MDHKELKNEFQNGKIPDTENTQSMKIHLNHSGKIIKQWNKEEVQVILDNVNNFNYKSQTDHVLELLQYLPDRTFSAIYGKLTFSRAQQKITRSYWSYEQIQTFQQAYEQYGTNWSLICETYFKNKTEFDCIQKYKELEDDGKKKLQHQVKSALRSIRDNLDKRFEQCCLKKLHSFTENLLDYAEQLEQQTVEYNFKPPQNFERKHIDKLAHELSNETSLSKLQTKLISYL